ncbi:MAG: dihydrolipoyl dehydrogenase [Desulfovibrio sp.]|nr:dihydrolipoyl dehydrogenase [Desulfovibrio sp.]
MPDGKPEIIIIGGGPGGYAAAFHAARSGARATLVEKGCLGGVCLHTGCIPTKTLLASALALETARRLAEFGIKADPSCHFAPDMSAVLTRKEKIRDTLRVGLEKTCASLNIRLVRGRAGLIAGGALVVSDDGSTERLSADAIILANGSKILELPSLPLDHQRVLSSDDALNLADVPRRLLVVGGGVIGCEMAFIFREFGAEVVIVEGLNRLLPLDSVDEEVSRLLLREAKKRRITAITAATVQRLTHAESGVRCLVGPSPFVPEAAGQVREIEADAVLVAVGRAPATEGLNLETVGVSTDSRGWIVTDERMRTSVPGIYAVGDALGPKRPMLAHTAAAEGICAVNSILGRNVVMDYSVIPSAVFTSPEIAAVGMTGAQAAAQGINARASQTLFRVLGKAQAMNELPGFFKLICEEGSGRLLGAHIVGARASDIVAEAALALRKGLTAADIAGTVHAHPTLAEGLCEAAQAWLDATKL